MSGTSRSRATLRHRSIAAHVARILLLALVAPCCGGGDEASPREQCETLFDVLCGRIGECFNARNGLEDSSLLQELCIARIEDAGFCDRAIGVTPAYDPCMSSLSDLDCAELFDEGNEINDDLMIPNVCQSVILTSS